MYHRHFACLVPYCPHTGVFVQYILVGIGRAHVDIDFDGNDDDSDNVFAYQHTFIPFSVNLI